MSWGLRNRLDRLLPGLPNGTAKATGSVVKKLQGEILSYAFLIILKGLKGDELLKPVPVFNILEY